MKKLFLLLGIFAFLTVPAYAQYGYAWRIIALPALPAVCDPANGDVVYLNNATPGLWTCTAVNTWRPAGFSGNSLVLNQGTLTVSTPYINHTATWNAGAVTFIDQFVNITDTASAAGSRLIDLQVGGASYFYVQKDGFTHAAAGVSMNAAGVLRFNTQSQLYSGADGRVNFTNNAGTAFTRFTMGPETVAGTALVPDVVGGQTQGIIIANGDGTTVSFAELGAATNGTIIYCDDCTKATPCAAAGTGALAKRYNGAWDCD